MDSVKALLLQAYEFVHMGFSDVKSQVAALIIAFIVAFVVMKSWRQILAVTLGSVVVLLLIQAIAPLFTGGQFVFPDVISGAYLMGAVALYVGFLVVIGVLFLIRSALFKGAKHAH